MNAYSDTVCGQMSAYDEGYAAHDEGIAEDDNPYLESGDELEYTEWLLGHRTSQLDNEKRCRKLERYSLGLERRDELN